MKKNVIEKKRKRERKRAKIRAKVFGTDSRPRLVIFRSNKHIWVQMIDDSSARTILAVSDKNLTKGKQKKCKGIERAKEVGKLLSEKAKKKKIKKAVFDRAGYKYHGQIKALVETVRANKIQI